ncbi:MAG TPA: DUF4266 domain-containing protein [Dongiaceae bacterium]|nr:DUF4266 domain-containing protein [Dongiaceae bacterium]
MKKLLLLPFVLVLAACTTTESVQPWERGQLARTDMAWNTDPLHNAMREHVYTSKEGASGGLSTGGGGCGCY